MNSQFNQPFIQTRSHVEREDYVAYLDGDSHRKFLNVIIPHVVGGRILDIGCGTATFFEELIKSNREFIELVGVEGSKDLVTLAQEKRLTNTTIYHANVFDYSYQAGYFDSVMLISVLHELYSYNTPDKIGGFFRTIFNTLKPGGRLIIFDGFRNDSMLVEVRFRTGSKRTLFEEFMTHRGKGAFILDGDRWVTSLTMAYDFIHKCYFESNWKSELPEYYYPLSRESYLLLLAASGFEVVTQIEFQEFENLSRIKEDFDIRFGKKSAVDLPCNWLLVAQKSL